MKNIAIIGSGGHANSLIDLINSSKKYKIIGYFDKKINTNIKLKYLGDENQIKKNQFNFAAMGIGLALKPKQKTQIIKKYLEIGIRFPKLIHKYAYVSNTSIIEDGVQIFAGSIINSNTEIKCHSVINTGSIVEHDCYIGEHCFICPGSVILGSSKIGKNTIIGSKNIILPNTKVINNSFIKAKI